MADRRNIFFDPKKHRYTDEFGNVFVSVTTLLGKYEYKFEDKQDDIAAACERIGRNPSDPRHERYAGMTKRQILDKWKAESDKSLVRGNKRHDYLENAIKNATGFIRLRAGLPGGRLYTIDDILVAHGYGRVNLADFVKAGVHIKFPRIFKIVTALVEDGYRLYSEIGVYNADYLISGLVDLLAVKDGKFIIVDWKTNKYRIRFEGGYYEKDNDGKVTGYKITNETMKPPVGHLQQSNGIKYALQTSLYAYLIELFGLVCEVIIICQILPELYDSTMHVPAEWVGKEIVQTEVVDYLRDDVMLIVDDYLYKRNNGQLTLGYSGY